MAKMSGKGQNENLNYLTFWTTGLLPQDRK